MRKKKSDTIYITLAGEAKSKSNKVFFRRGRTYIPQDVVDWEDSLRQAAIVAMAGREPFKVPVKFVMRMYRSNKRRCDLGNYNKSACDALNGIVYHDDCLICEEHMFKFLDEDNPRIEIEVSQWTIPEGIRVPIVLPK